MVLGLDIALNIHYIILCMEYPGNYALECKSTKGYESLESGEKKTKLYLEDKKLESPARCLKPSWALWFCVYGKEEKMEAIVTLQSVRDSEIKDFQLIVGDSFEEICKTAFFGRNIASSWNVVELEYDFDDSDISSFMFYEFYKTFLPIIGEDYVRTGRLS